MKVNILDIKLTFIWGIPGRFDKAEFLTFFHSSMLWMTTKNDTPIFRFFRNFL